MPSKSHQANPDFPGGGESEKVNGNGRNGNGHGELDLNSAEWDKYFIELDRIFDSQVPVYRATSNGKFSEKLPSVAVPPELNYAVAIILQKGQQAGVPYQEKGGFIRDAVYRHVKWWQKKLGQDSELALMVDASERINRDTFKASARLNQDKAFAVYEDEMKFYVENEAWDQLHSRLALVVAFVKAARLDTWWYERWKSRTALSRSFVSAVQELQRRGYAETECVNTLSLWIEEERAKPQLRNF